MSSPNQQQCSCCVAFDLERRLRIRLWLLYGVVHSGIRVYVQKIHDVDSVLNRIINTTGRKPWPFLLLTRPTCTREQQ